MVSSLSLIGNMRVLLTEHVSDQDNPFSFSYPDMLSLPSTYLWAHTQLYLALTCILLWSLQPCSVLAQAPAFFSGVDLSNLDRSEASGAVFSMSQGTADPVELFANRGINLVRLRIWHSPDEGYHNTAYTLELAKRAKAQRMQLLLDFHYSDSWADPAKQFKPAPWTNLTFETLKDSLYAYTFDTISAFNAANALPDLVQLGNEIIQGLLWDEGRVGGSFDTPTQWGKLAALLDAAKAGVLDAAPDNPPLIMIHIDRGADQGGTNWFFDNLVEQGFEFDVIGQSFYPWWHGTLSALEQNLNATTIRYQKPVMLVEVAYPWTLQWFDNTNNIIGESGQLLPGYPASPQGQADYLEAVRTIVQSIPNSMGKGLIYWEPAWIAAPGFGSPWENLALFNDSGEPLPGIAALAGSATNTAIDQGYPQTPPLHVYPNPFFSKLNLESTSTKYRGVEIKLTDILGRQVFTKTANHLPQQLELPTWLTPGVYVLSIKTGTSWHRKLLVRGQNPSDH